MSLNSFTDEYVIESKVAALMEKVKLCPVPSMAAQIVEIRLKSGARLMNRYDYLSEISNNLVSEEELIEKHRGCTSLALSEGLINNSIDALRNLERIDNISETPTNAFSNFR